MTQVCTVKIIIGVYMLAPRPRRRLSGYDLKNTASARPSHISQTIDGSTSLPLETRWLTVLLGKKLNEVRGYRCYSRAGPFVIDAFSKDCTERCLGSGSWHR